MPKNIIARTSLSIAAPAARVWDALVNPQLTIELSGEGAETRVSLSQDNNASEEVREHSEKNWKTMLEGLKKLLEK